MAYSTSTSTRGAQRMGRLYREWRRLRDQAGELLYLVVKARRLGHGEAARSIYEDWKNEKIGFEEAKKKLEQLLAEARAAARA